MAGKVKRRQKKQQKRFSRPMQGVALAMLANQLFLPMAAQAVTPVIPGYYGKVNLPAVTLNQLPQLKSGGMQSNATVATSGNNMTITQTAPRAIIDWDEFNIGVSASVYFSQKQNGVAQTGWAALNRIYDINPSQIYGSLKADGRIYLLNQNGILFGSGSTVNVHTLVASSLKMDLQKLISTASSAYADDPSNKTSLDIWSNPGQFLDETTSLNLTKFTKESWNGLSNNLHATGGGVIANEGTITSSGTTNEQGGVFLIGGAVENHGTITAPAGQIALVAGNEVNLSSAYKASEDTLRQGALTVKVTGVESGTDALNGTTGNLLADQGMVGMYGNRVTQNGLIRSISTVKRNGTIELLAKERITTGVGSVTATPVSDSAELLDSSFVYDEDGNFAYNTWIHLAGLDYSSNPNVASQIYGNTVEGIEHLGSIVAPGAKVVLNAQDRVFLGNQSWIDVSGSRALMSVRDKLISTTLTSNELRDSQNQKNGILSGAAVTTNTLTGTGLANLSNLVTGQPAVAQQWTVNAGSVEINAHKGDIVMKDGAAIDISGGVTRYSSGDLSMTALVYGTKVYGLSNAPSNLTYTSILGNHTKTYNRFGVEEKYKGLSFGGANRLFNPAAFDEGGNAGKLTMQARQLLLDGQIRSSVTRGLFQTRLDEIRDTSGNALTRGLKMPDGGTLMLGAYSYGSEANQILDGVVITKTAEDQTNAITGYDEKKFSTPAGSTTTSVISSSKLSLPENSLSNLQIYTNSSITTTADSNLTLLPGGSVTLRAQQVEHNGSISVPSGNVDISLLDHIVVQDKDNKKASVTLPTASQVLLASGSSISTAGLQNRDYTDTISANYVNGGSISIKDMTGQGIGVQVHQGALLSVDGGYTLDKKGKATAGNAGSLTLAGSNVDLQQGAIISGKAMVGKKGGSLSIHSNWMTLANQYRSVSSGTVLGTDQLLDSGFATLNLTGVFGLTVEEGTRLPATLARLVVDGSASQVAVTGDPGLSGSMGVTLKAGVTLDYSDTTYLAVSGIQGKADLALLTVEQGADLTIVPEGAISLSAPAVAMDGTLRSNSGTITVKASGLDSTARDLTIGSSALLDASGYNKPVTMKLGSNKFYETTPRDGGSISLTSSNGTVSMAEGAMADVSGTTPNTVTVPNSDGLSVSSTTVAGSAGSVTISGVSLDLQGSLQAATHLAGTKGGTLGISTSSDALTVTGSQIGSYLGAGFDALSFGSSNELILSGSMDQRIGRRLTLDAPLISGTSDSIINLYAPWINLTNSTYVSKAATNGTAQLNLRGNNIDLSGSVALGGFSTARLAATGDISATEKSVKNDTATLFRGEFKTAGDLILQAARVYPKNYAYTTDSKTKMIPSEFLIKSTEGSVTFLSSGGPTNGFLDSAGGSLTVEAENGINQSGTLLAPLGRISLNATGNNSRVYLAPGSITSIRGTSDTVQLGYLDSDGNLVLPTNGSDSGEVVVASVDDLAKWRGTASGVFINDTTVSGTDQREVVQANDALVDVSGGGGVFAYQFFPGAAGSVDPLKVSGRFVVVPQATAPLGGQTIYLAGGNGIAAGVYTIVPERYAFLSDALIVSDAGSYVAPGSSNRTTEGYNIIAGYLSEANTGISSSRYRGYTVRLASDVLKEGEFTKSSEIIAGNGGNVSINGATILLDGTFRAQALASDNTNTYTGGTISLAGTNMTVQNSSASTTGGIDFSSAIPSDLKGTVSVSSDALSGQGFKSVTLGSTTATDTLTIAEGSNLAVDGDLNLYAKNLVEVKANSNLSGEALALASPTGSVTVAEGATLTGTKSVDFEVLNNLDMKGTLNTALVNLTGENIVVNDGSATGVTGLNLTPALWDTLNSFGPAIGLKSRNNLIFASSANLATAKDLTIDAAGFVADATDITAKVSAANLTLKNSGTRVTTTPADAKDNTSLTLQASSISVDLSHPTGTSAANVGDIVISGFTTTTLQAANDLALGGNGTLNSSGSLNLEAARITTAASTDRTYKNYLPAKVLVQAANTMTINQSTGKAGTSMTPGGSLAFKAADITQAGTVEMQSGTLKFDATNSLTFAKGSQTLNQGSATGAGGSIVATATNGALTIADGASLNVSAGSQGDSGSISLTAVSGGVTVGANTLQGSGTGTGGSFSMDSNFIDDSSTTTVNELTPLLTTLAKGGFTEQINLRARTGDLTVADSLTGDEIIARRVSLATDSGKLSLEGQITTGSGKGQVELYAADDLTLAAGSSITVTGGGEANLGSSSGTLTMASGSLLDLSDNNGTVNLRALRDTAQANGVKMALNGEIRGASEVAVEAVKVYSGVSNISAANITTWKNDTTSYMANANSYRTNLLSGLTMANTDAFKFKPGVEAQSSGSMTLGAALDLKDWRYTVNGKSETGLLTLRSAGDLTLSSTITDFKTARVSLHSSSMQDSWDLRLVAGASGADPLGVTKGSGKLTVTGGVYTENGDINFASGADTIINTAALSGHMINTNLKYTLASYGGSIHGEVGNNLVLNAGVIQDSVGDIDLAVGGDLNLNGSSTMGAIRTTGEAATTAGITKYYTYGNGGDLLLDLVGSIQSSISGTSSFNPWDTATSVRVGSKITPYWHADYATSGGLRGIAAMAGGDVAVTAGGGIYAQIGSFAPTVSSGNGNLTVSSGANMNGRFLSGSGDAFFSSQGGFGTDEEVPVISAAYTRDITVSAQGDIWLGTVDNPTIAHPSYSTSYKKWELTYLPESSLSLNSLNGNITLTGADRFYSSSSSTDHGERRILPASLSMQAAKNITLQNSFVLAPSAAAELNVAAGGDIIGTAGATFLTVGSRLIMSDLNPSEVYGAQTSSQSIMDALLNYTQTHSTSLTEVRDTSNPVRVTAGGNITDLELDLVKQARISAGGDITDLHYVGQNINYDDQTSITAGGDITLHTAGLSATEGVYTHTGFMHGGPGMFMVAAGGNIDLGATRGIQTYGNHQNAALFEYGSDLFVLAGVTKSYTADKLSAFFNDLQAGGQEYALIKAEGDAASSAAAKAEAETAAAAKLEELRTTLINPFVEGGLVKNMPDDNREDIGNINMVSSQISTLTGNEISIMTGGKFNVGKSTFYESSSQKNTGVYTALGGNINIFSRGDVDVKESRLMTFYGGDITVWSDEGIINAGRGSKGAINPSQSLKVMRDDGSYITRFSPPSVGSGVRAMTYDSGIDIPVAWDMSKYPNYKSASSIPAYNPDKISPTRPVEGAVTLIARIVDAGEAGIYGGKVYIGAKTVLNAPNISSSGVSVGVPAQTTTTSLGTLSGSGTLNEGSRMLVESTAMGNKSLVEKVAAADSFVTAWLDVKVLGFEENPPN